MRSLQRARKVTRIDRSYAFVFESARGRLRLFASARRERRRGVTAKTAGGVSFRLAVPDEKDVRIVGHRAFNLSGDGFGLQLLRLVVSDERVDERIEIAFHHEVELVNC